MKYQSSYKQNTTHLSMILYKFLTIRLGTRNHVYFNDSTYKPIVLSS